VDFLEGSKDLSYARVPVNLCILLLEVLPEEVVADEVDCELLIVAGVLRFPLGRRHDATDLIVLRILDTEVDVFLPSLSIVVELLLQLLVDVVLMVVGTDVWFVYSATWEAWL
jgi:hypothetical protein